MILPSEQNPGENEEHFVFQDPDHRYRRAVVKQELADVRRSHRFDVHRNAHERRRANLQDWREILRGEAFNREHLQRPHCPCPFTSDNVEGEPRALRDKIWNPCAAARSISPCRPTSFVVILFSGRTRQPAPQQTTMPKLTRSMSLKTPPSSPRTNRSEMQKAARPSQSFRSKSLGATIVPDDSGEPGGPGRH